MAYFIHTSEDAANPGRHNYERLWSPTWLGIVPAMIVVAMLLESCTDGVPPTATTSSTGFSATTISLPTGLFPAVTFSPNGKVLAVATKDGVSLVDLTNPSAQPTQIKNASRVLSTSFTPDGRQLAYGDEDGILHVAQLQGSGFPSMAFSAYNYEVRSVTYSPDGKMLAVGGIDNTADQPVELWTASQMKQGPQKLPGHLDTVSSVAFDPSGRILASGSTDGTIRIWNVTQPQSPGIVLNDVGRTSQVAFSPNGNLLAAAGDDGTVRVWDAHALSAKATPTVINNQSITSSSNNSSERSANTLAFSPNGEQLAVGYEKGIIQLFNVNDLAQAPKVIQGFNDAVESVAFSPDGRILAGASTNVIKLWNMMQPSIVDPSITVIP